MLVLFDIDGTILSCHRQTRAILGAALETVFGSAGDLEGYPFSGRTDHQIVSDLAASAGVSPERFADGLPRVRTIYLELLEERLDGRRMTLFPGVVELLDALAARRTVTLGLLTGNWEGGARTKLSRFDLNGYFPFGAFGDDQPMRRGLPPIALANARRVVGRTFRPEETVIIGDSPLDVDCARAHGMLSVAVTTGWTSREELEAAGADRVVDGLADGAALLEELVGAAGDEAPSVAG